MFKSQWMIGEVSEYLKNFNFIQVMQYPSHGSFGCANDTLFIKAGIKSPKLNTILETYKFTQMG